MLASCLLTQLDYLNRALDLFNTAVVSPIYYVMFTLLSISASVIMFQVGGTRKRGERAGSGGAGGGRAAGACGL